jgi:hypothetical protein
MSKKVLIVVHINTFFVELFRVAKLLRSSRKFNPIVMFPYRYPTDPKDIALCIQSRIPCIDENGERIIDAGPVKPIAETPSALSRNTITRLTYLQFLKAIYQRLISLFARSSVFKMIQEFRCFQEKKRFVKKILREQDPALVLLGGDMVGYDTSVYIQVAHQENIPVIIVPSSMSNGLEQAEAYYYHPEFNLQKWINRLAARLFPKWVFAHRGRRLLRVPGERVFVMECLGLSPPLPWIFNSGFADAIAIESERMRKYYLDCGIPDNQMKVTGSLADDVMVDILKRRQSLRKKFCLEYGLDPEKPILVSALPGDSLYMYGGRPQSDFKTYPELVKYWIQSIAKVKNYNVIVCLHPSVNIKDFQYIEDWGVKIAKSGTAEIVPLSDLYVASVSSTIRWAIACGIPVINYDVYRYHYTDYVDLKGVIAVEKKKDFEFVLNKITQDTRFYKQKKEEQELSASQWGLFDGKVGKRIQELFDSMLQIYSKENGRSD